MARRKREITLRQVWGGAVFVGLVVATNPLPVTDGWLQFRAGVVIIGWLVGTWIVPIASALRAMIWLDRRWGSGRVAREEAEAAAYEAAGLPVPRKGWIRRKLILRKAIPILGRKVKANVNMNGWTSTSIRPSKRVVYNTQRGGRIDLPGPFSIPFLQPPPKPSRARTAARAALPPAKRRAMWRPVPGMPSTWEMTETYGAPIIRRPKPGTQSTEEFCVEGPGGTTVVYKRLRQAIAHVCPPVIVGDDREPEVGDPVGDGFDVDGIEIDPDATPPAGYQWDQESPQHAQSSYPWERGMSEADRANVEAALRRMDETKRRRR